MKLYGICLVKDEGDIINQTLEYATRYCDKIIVIDNGSTDSTWNIVHELASIYPQIIPLKQTNERFDDGLRWLAFDAYQHELGNDDWWMILDGDEFLAEDPRPILQDAMRNQAEVVMTWQIQFYFTEEDLAKWDSGHDSRDTSIIERRRYYRIDWSEPRFFKSETSGNWETSNLRRQLPMPPWLRTKITMEKWTTQALPSRKGKIFKRRILNRHYQYRDPIQMEKRLKLRYGHASFASQAETLVWKKKMRHSNSLIYYKNGDPWHFSLSGLAYYYSGWIKYVIFSRLARARDRIMEYISK